MKEKDRSTEHTASGTRQIEEEKKYFGCRKSDRNPEMSAYRSNGGERERERYKDSMNGRMDRQQTDGLIQTKCGSTS